MPHPACWRFKWLRMFGALFLFPGAHGRWSVTAAFRIKLSLYELLCVVVITCHGWHICLGCRVWTVKCHLQTHFFSTFNVVHSVPNHMQMQTLQPWKCMRTWVLSFGRKCRQLVSYFIISYIKIINTIMDMYLTAISTAPKYSPVIGQNCSPTPISCHR